MEFLLSYVRKLHFWRIKTSACAPRSFKNLVKTCNKSYKTTTAKVLSNILWFTNSFFHLYVNMRQFVRLFGFQHLSFAQTQPHQFLGGCRQITEKQRHRQIIFSWFQCLSSFGLGPAGNSSKAQILLRTSNRVCIALWRWQSLVCIKNQEEGGHWIIRHWKIPAVVRPWLRKLFGFLV